MARHDAVVVGAGPNGLAAAILLARAGRSVVVLEGASTPGGGMRSAELTAPGFVHDVCSAIHPMGIASPFLRSLPLDRHGLEWLRPAVDVAHPLDDGTAAVLRGTVADTAAGLGPDARAYHRIVSPVARSADAVVADALGPLLRPPRHPVAMARFGMHALRSAKALTARFSEPRAKALLGGLAAHTELPLDKALTGGVGLLFLALAHAHGFPMAKGGSGSIADAMLAHLRELDGEVVCDRPVRTMADVPDAKAVLFDVTPRQLVDICGDRLPARYRRQASRFRYGPGVFKVDWALDGPVPWTAPGCAEAGTLHLGGTFEELAASEAEVSRGGHPERPVLIVAQHTATDPSRAPAGKHTLWAYCHVPNGSTVDMTERIEAQVERFAPGFRDLILARSVRGPATLEAHNPNHIGGDINGGAQDLRQHVFRPVVSWDPYATGAEGVFLCSSSTPPGGGVHGMCGYHAARSALRSVLR